MDPKPKAHRVYLTSPGSGYLVSPVLTGGQGNEEHIVGEHYPYVILLVEEIIFYGIIISSTSTFSSFGDLYNKLIFTYINIGLYITQE